MEQLLQVPVTAWIAIAGVVGFIAYKVITRKPGGGTGGGGGGGRSGGKQK